ncbi:spore germination protein KA [Caldanaerobius fijiensis DSM 17918]|uniref:Spore germination protein KA n=1 Tax=Caldanaerobius fijiensis DSM 17918 TaxID=1121256 RepID=A0A1M4SPB4_9THEO|nr:spore germination protein [Caldanaerobius fijiensis]SHE34036.1 spore germination protein KA [Caldanaerobius fijiensis DSM 17918]
MLNFIKNLFTGRQNEGRTENKDVNIAKNLDDNEKYIKTIFDKCSDIVIRKFNIANNPNYKAALIYIDGMIQQNIIEESIIKRLTNKNADHTYNPGSEKYSKYLLGIKDEDIYEKMDNAIEAILNGNPVLFINGISKALNVNLKNPPGRNIEEPTTETVVRGSREGFSESIRINTCLLRKKIKNVNLKMECLKIGKQTKTDVVISYLANIANHKIVNEVKERLSKIDIDSVLDSNFIEEYIDDHPLSFFPTIFRTEKPDVAAGKLLEGRIAIIVDGTPTVLTVPAIFAEFIQTGEDYYMRFIPATLNRWLRYFSFFLSLTLPGFYVALVTFHQELVPTSLVVTIIKARAGVPLPSLWECFMMLLAYEILREAGVRMPRAVGQAVSVVGALVLGQAAVEAGLVSTPMVIVTALTGIASFTIPSPEMNMALTYPRFILLFLGGTLGILGLTCGLLIMLMNLISMRSFGVPYMGPIVPLIMEELPDIAIRAPLWSTIRRPKLITWKRDNRRQTITRISSIKQEQEKATQQKLKEK